MVRKRRGNKSRISFCVVFNFLLCWSCCEEELKAERELSRESRDVADSGSYTFSRSSNSCSIHVTCIKLYCRNWVILTPLPNQTQCTPLIQSQHNCVDTWACKTASTTSRFIFLTICIQTSLQHNNILR